MVEILKSSECILFFFLFLFLFLSLVYGDGVFQNNNNKNNNRRWTKKTKFNCYRNQWNRLDLKVMVEILKSSECILFLFLFLFLFLSRVWWWSVSE